MSQSKVSGVGTRYGAVFPLDSSGLPMPATATAVPMQGTLIEAIKGMAVTDPEPQRITHYGDDQPYAQDSLPPTEAGSFSFNTSKTNLDLDAMVEGGKVRTINSNKFIGGNSDNRGSEPQMMVHIYRQALDTDRNSSSFGKLRQWESRIYPSARIAKQTPAFEAQNTDVTYNATPTRVKFAPWFEQFNETNWGFSEAEYITHVTDYQPRINTYRGDGTITAFQLSHPPKTSTEVTVWVDGTQTTPTNVNTSANPSFTLGSAAGVGKLVFALAETDEPGNN